MNPKPMVEALARVYGFTRFERVSASWQVLNWWVMPIDKRLKMEKRRLIIFGIDRPIEKPTPMTLKNYYCGPCNWSGIAARAQIPAAPQPKCPQCGASLSEAPTGSPGEPLPGSGPDPVGEGVASPAPGGEPKNG